MGGYGLFYIFNESTKNIRENLIQSLFSTITVAFSLCIFAFFFVLFVNLNRMVENWGERTHIVVYIKDGALKSGVENLTSRLQVIPGVKEVDYISKDDALAVLKQELKEHREILDGIGSDMMPASFEIKLDKFNITLEGVGKIVERLNGIEWVEDIDYAAEWVERFSSVLRFMEVFAAAIGVFLLSAAIFIISNTIRLTIYARRQEIEIMKYLGATQGFVKIPFLIEGVFAGILGGIFALGILIAGKYIISFYIPQPFVFLLKNPFSPFFILLMLAFAGSIMGFIGSFVSLGRFLKI